MNSSQSTHGETYSPFWPIFIVFAVFLLLQVLEVKNRITQRQQMTAASTQLTSLVPKAQTIQKTLENVGHDLMTLSDGKTNEAAKIIAEFGIQMNAPTTATPSPAPAAAPTK